jgi:hypothetical protein
MRLEDRCGILEEIIPFPREETTPPVTKMKKVPDISFRIYRDTNLRIFSERSAQGG